MRKITDKPTRGEVSDTVDKHGEDMEKKTEQRHHGGRRRGS